MRVDIAVSFVDVAEFREKKDLVEHYVRGLLEDIEYGKVDELLVKVYVEGSYEG